MKSFPETTESWLLDGPCGTLEVATALPEKQQDTQHKTIAIICHPHPLYDGTMHNKVVTTVAKAYQRCGYYAIRFNFRGVGQSTGEYAQGIGEVEDLSTVVAWARSVMPEAKLCLGGFSFGGAVALRAASALRADALCTIAPGVHETMWREIPSVAMPWLLIMGEEDETILPDNIKKWLETRPEHPKCLFFEECGHFFHSQLIKLRETLIQELPELMLNYSK